MKLLTGAILLSLGCSSAAYAQSSVTLYGSVDAGIGYNNNVGGHSQWQAVNGNTQPDVWGLLGSEDLGGGFHANFQLENGFSTITGAMTRSGYIFNRIATVGLSSDTYGSLTMGHMRPFSGQWINPLDSAVLGYFYQNYHPGNIDELSANTNSIEDNMVRYVSPNYKGLEAGAEISLGGVAGNFGTNKSVAYAIRYNNGPIRLAAAYSIENNRPTAIGSAIGFTTFQGVAGTAVYTAAQLKNFDVAGAYRIGLFTLHALYTNVQLNNNGFSNTFQTIEAGTTIRPTPFDLVDVTAYTSTLTGHRWSQLALVDVYSFSKSTSVYAGVALQRATGGAKAVIYSNTPSSNNNQIAFRTGIHHSF